MQLRAGDWVKTESGEVGKVVHITRLTVFVQIEAESEDATLKAYLMSQLVRVHPRDDWLSAPD
jgi:hypothetical protein